MNRAVSGRSTARPRWIRSPGRVNPKSVLANSSKQRDLFRGVAGRFLSCERALAGGNRQRTSERGEPEIASRKVFLGTGPFQDGRHPVVDEPHRRRRRRGDHRVTGAVFRVRLPDSSNPKPFFILPANLKSLFSPPGSRPPFVIRRNRNQAAPFQECIPPQAGIQFVTPGIVDRRVERPPESPSHYFRSESLGIGEHHDARIGLSHQTGFQFGNVL